MNNSFDITALNNPQREAVEHIEKPTLVLAGAGSGKTRVLTHKIAYLVSLGVKPWRILAVTFTNKAAREMIARTEKLLSIPVKGLWIGTFHSICVRILRREAERWGINRDFTIYDRDDQLAAIKKAMREIGMKKEVLSPSRILHIIGRAKNDLVSPEELHNNVSGPYAGLIVSIYKRYNELLKAAGAFDFDDLIARPVEKFSHDRECLRVWQKRFSHILIDEYQDTNRTQYLFMKLLSGDSGNVTVVGDDDQSIYSWRGANIQNILGFEHDFINVKVIRLEQNYRSTKTILKAANAVVVNNKGRMSKKLWTERHDGSPVKVIECMDDYEEAEQVVLSIEREKKELSYVLRDFVILYRTNAQSRSFEEVLRRRGIPYIIVGGLRFYERKEIKDILAYLRIIANPDDAVSFGRIITTHKRGVGPKTIEKLETLAKVENITIVEAVGRAEEVITSVKILKELKELYALFQSLSQMRGKFRLYEIGQALVSGIKYEEYLKSEYPDNFDERVNNVHELIAALRDFENLSGESDLSIFLANVTLMTDVDMWDDTADALTLMTLHSAKGLEFPSVYIAGVERGLFPLPQTFESEQELEEERRLFYVGITRAQEYLHISYALNRIRHGSWGGGASMFMYELPGEVLDYECVEQNIRLNRPQKNRSIRHVMEFEDYSQEVSDSDDNKTFRVGSYVRHPVFGRGCIMARSGSGDNLMLTILFGTEKKKIMVKYGKLVPA